MTKWELIKKAMAGECCILHDTNSWRYENNRWEYFSSSMGRWLIATEGYAYSLFQNIDQIEEYHPPKEKKVMWQAVYETSDGHGCTLGPRVYDNTDTCVPKNQIGWIRHEVEEV